MLGKNQIHVSDVIEKYVSNIYIIYVLLCTIINNIYFILIFFSILLIFLILAFYRQKKWQNEVLIKKDELTTDQKKYKNRKNYKKYNILIRFLLFIYVTVDIILKIQKYKYHQNLLCGQSRQQIELVVDGEIVSEKKGYNYVLDTKYGLLQTNIFTQPVYRVGEYINIVGTVECSSIARNSFNKILIPFSYSVYQYAHGIVASLQSKQVSVTTQQNNTFTGSSKTILTTSRNKNSLLHDNSSLFQFSSQYQGLPEGLLFGMTDTMSPAIYQLFIDSGLVYLVAASGGNISFVVSLVSWVLFFLITKRRKTTAFLSVFLYTYVLRTNIALIRAFISYCINLFMRRTGRRVSSLQIYTIIVICVTLIDPYIMISSRGFILSMSGVRGIILIPYTIGQHRILRYIAPPVRTFLALLGPLLLLTNKVNLTTILVSLPAQVLATIISYLSLIILLLGDNIFFISILLKTSINWLIILAKRAVSYKIIISSYSQFVAYLLRSFVWIALYWLHKTQKTIKSCHN